MTDFRVWLRLLASLADEPSKLSNARLNEERAAAFSITTRGWALLAGETSKETVVGIECEAIEAINRLVPQLKQQRGRKEGRQTPQSRAVNQQIISDLRAGLSLRKAAEKAGAHQAETHRRRIQRARAAERRRIAVERGDNKKS